MRTLPGLLLCIVLGVMLIGPMLIIDRMRVEVEGEDAPAPSSVTDSSPRWIKPTPPSNDPPAIWRYEGIFEVRAMHGPCSLCETGKKTASGWGVMNVDRHMAAADESFPFGTTLYIEGLGPYVVAERIPKHRRIQQKIEVVLETHTDCVMWGCREKRVWSLAWGAIPRAEEK